MSDDFLTFSDDQPPTPIEIMTPWKILIVDDDQDVHSVTELVMHGVRILDRPLEFLHAYRASEAIETLQKDPDIAVILLDVVMESENAGFQLVRHVRETLRLEKVRIILRTGQPGYAPEYEAIRDYDINDYRTKSELSYARFLTSLTSALRSYTQISRISRNTEQLDFILQSAPLILNCNTVEAFNHQLESLLEGVLHHSYDLCVLHQPQLADPDRISPPLPLVIRATGTFAPARGHEVDFSGTQRIPGLTHREMEVMKQSYESCHSIFDHRLHSLYLEGTHSGNLIVLVRSGHLEETDTARLVETAGLAATMGFQNMNLVNQLRDLAFIDGITGLQNRLGIITEIDRIRLEGKLRQCLVLIDIEGFSELNEALGHRYGDAILKAISLRMKEYFPPTVHLGRVGGDGFVALGPEPLMIPEALNDMFARPFTINQYSMYLRVVYGLVRLDEVQGDGADLLKDAYLAVKTAKLQKQNRFFWYDPRVESENRNRILMLQDLQQAMDQGSLMVWYQPQVSIDGARITGFEALLRWRKPDGTFIPPGVFVPLAEQSGLIVGIGNWLIGEVLRQKSEWDRIQPTHIRVAINVSVRQFYNPGFIEMLRSLIEAHGVTAEDVEIEITESMAMNSIQEVAQLLGRLKDLGLKIALDDFGTGFSSLSYLQQLPIDRIKIDKAFVDTIHLAETHRALASTIVQMGLSLGKELIAEGVELPIQREILENLGCHEAQGYLFGKPMSGEECRLWIQNYGK